MEKKGLTLSERVKKELEGFDHRKEYVCDGTNGLSPQRHKVLVGKISNLIADMTLAGATEDELIKVVKYSMVAIDALRYNLDYKKAADDLNYSKFYKKYSSFERRKRDGGNA